MLRAVGFGDGDFGKPIIGIANGYSTITPCNAGLNLLADRAAEACAAAGAMAAHSASTPATAKRGTGWFIEQGPVMG